MSSFTIPSTHARRQELWVICQRLRPLRHIHGHHYHQSHSFLIIAMVTMVEMRTIYKSGAFTFDIVPTRYSCGWVCVLGMVNEVSRYSISPKVYMHTSDKRVLKIILEKALTMFVFLPPWKWRYMFSVCLFVRLFFQIFKFGSIWYWQNYENWRQLLLFSFHRYQKQSVFYSVFVFMNRDADCKFPFVAGPLSSP